MCGRNSIGWRQNVLTCPDVYDREIPADPTENYLADEVDYVDRVAEQERKFQQEKEEKRLRAARAARLD